MKKNNEKELQTEFDINDDNYEMYDKLYCLEKDIVRSGDIYGNIASIVCSCSCALSALGFTTLTYFATSALNFGDAGVTICTIASGIGTLAVAFPTTLKISRKIEENRFKKLYPNVNMDVDADELGKALERYKELSTVPKDVEYQVEERLEKCSDEVKKLSTSEKIEYYKEQKEFWEKVAIQEKYGLLDMNEIAKVKSKKDEKKIN